MAERRQSIKFSDTNNLFLLANHEDSVLSAWKISSMNRVNEHLIFQK